MKELNKVNKDTVNSIETINACHSSSYACLCLDDMSLLIANVDINSNATRLNLHGLEPY